VRTLEFEEGFDFFKEKSSCLKRRSHHNVHVRLHRSHHGNKALHGIRVALGDYLYPIRTTEGVACFIVVVWIYICVAFAVPNPLKSMMIWGMILLLAFANGVINPEGRC